MSPKPSTTNNMNLAHIRSALRRCRWPSAVLAAFLFLIPATHAADFYVSTNGNDTLAGNSWPSAKRTLGAAIAAASGPADIWVARGTYPEHITLKPGIRVFGGFAGGEQTLSARDWRTNLSVIWGTTNKVVISITNSGPDTWLDGLTIGGGNGIHGGGIAMVGSGPILANNTIRNNITDGAGSGISIWGFHLLSSTAYHFPIVTNNVIVDNQSINDEGDGAGIAVIGSSPFIAWNVIARNTATRNGGGIACWRHSFPVIANNIIEANSASYDEATASSGGGGIFASATDLDGRPISGAISAPTIINNVIAANGGRHGGGITVVDSRLGAALIVNNTIVANNGAGIFWANTWPTNDNNLVVFNVHGFERGAAGTSDAVIRNNDVYDNAVLGTPRDYVSTEDRTGADGNLSCDPRFANAAIGNYHLQPDSPCINAGSSVLIQLGLSDIDRQPRIQGVNVDLGADEATGQLWQVPTPVVRVSPGGDDTDGKTWATAKTNVGAGIALASVSGGEVWVAQGIYPEHIAPPAFVYLYGGFAGTETTRADRRPIDHPAVLDGAGVPTVVYFRNAGYRASALDGFTVQNGGAYTAGDPFFEGLATRTGGRGGGIYCRVSAPDIVNNIIRSNSIGSPYNSFEAYGGGLYCYLSHAQVRSNSFFENEVLKRMNGDGGGIYCNESMATIEGNSFVQNRALDGAAVFAWISDLRISHNLVLSNALYHSVPSLYMGSGYGALSFWGCSNVLVEANWIRGNSGSTGGGIYLSSCTAGLIQNNLVKDNLAYDYSGFGAGGMGGGIYCMINLNAAGQTRIVHNTILSNNAPASILGHLGGGIAMTLITNTITLANNIIAGNSSGIWRDWRTSVMPSLSHNCLENPTNYVYVSPHPTDILANPLLAAGGYHLSAASPCIDAADMQYALNSDLEDIARPLDGNNDGACLPDIGAAEFLHPSADSDRDGALDAAEVVAGTNPVDPHSHLDLAARFLGANKISLEWLSVPGRSYILEFRNALGSPETWQSLPGEFSGNGELLHAEDTRFDSSRFYRIGVVRN
jgi:hypothetical protein